MLLTVVDGLHMKRLLRAGVLGRSDSGTRIRNGFEGITDAKWP